jgi:putative transposase
MGQKKGTGYFSLAKHSIFSYAVALMPRIPRGQVAGHAYHVLNRGNGGATVFHKVGDYTAFLDLLATAKAKYPVKLLGFCLMPNHFHLVVQPATEAALSHFMQWWMTSHVRRYHRHYRSHGHVWQGRFKSFPIQEDGHLLTVLRYVLRNPVRAGLVEQTIQWPWSSLRVPHLTDAAPIPLPEDGMHWIDQPLFEQELTALRTCVNRQQPFGAPEWQQRLATALGLESTLRRRGRPSKIK